MKSLVIYDSYFGNTQKIAEIIARELKCDAIKVDQAKIEDISGLDLLIVGSPTRGFRPTQNITTFVAKLSADSLKNVKVAVFDTRIDAKDIKSKAARTFLGFMIKMFGYADKPLEKSLVAKGASATVADGFYVLDSKGPLKNGEIERAKKFAQKLMD